MLIGSTKSALLSYATALETSCDADVSKHLRKLASILGHAGNVATKTLVSQLSKADMPASADGEDKLADLIPALEGLVVLLTDLGVKKQLVGDIGLVLDLVRQHGKVSINEFESTVQRPVVSPPRRKAKKRTAKVDNELVENYLARLEKALNNSTAFPAVYDELYKNKRVTRLEAVEIASRFFGPVAASTSRPRALRRILHRHEKLMESRAVSEVIDGQAA